VEEVLDEQIEKPSEHAERKDAAKVFERLGNAVGVTISGRIDQQSPPGEDMWRKQIQHSSLCSQNTLGGDWMSLDERDKVMEVVLAFTAGREDEFKHLVIAGD
jgi:hypothetical protein